MLSKIIDNHMFLVRFKSLILKLDAKKLMVFSLIFLGLLTRFVFISHPNQTVFDEVHFGKFVSSYFTGKYYFDIHPPLGKMIIALGAGLGGYGDYVARHGVFDFEKIGESFGAVPYFWFRFFPALAGSLIPLAVFLFMLEFGAGRLASFLAGLLLVFENSLLVESRLVLTDAFLILFGFLGLYFFFRARNRNYPNKLLFWSGLFFAASFSVKWTGLGFFGACGLIYLWDILDFSLIKPGFFLPARRLAPAANRGTVLSPQKVARGDTKLFGAPRTGKNLGYLILGALALVSVPFAIYFAVFQIHFALLPACPESGGGCEFMSQEFKNRGLNPWQSFLELNQKMWVYNKGISESHEYGSKALGWPLMIRPVYYWVLDSARIYLIGNPVIWFLGFFGIFAFLFLKISAEKKILLWLLYLANLVPFILVSRVLFLYHYLLALIVSVMAFSLVVDEVFKEKKIFVWGAVLALAVFGFLFFAPLSYGFPLSETGFARRQWSSFWFSGNSQLKEFCEKTNCSVLKWIVY
ncbi:MAG: Glycosyl transferase family 39 [Parcubacteria group bacterium GW2011_GWC1_45_9]|nr:MAG: Glycosyl transferase family 39 [Parcubacteria group bacterium GW2011_GWC1_45_9]